MKRLFLLLLIVLAAGAWIGEKMVKDPGYVLITYSETSIETSLWVLLVIAAVGFLALHWAVNLFFKARIPTHKIREWRQRRQQASSQGKTLKGLLALSEGRWWKAQRLLTQAAETSGQPLVNYLAAARAAHEQREDKAVDQLLQQALTSVPQAELAIGVTQAQIQLERGQYDPALATLLRLRRLAPKHSYIMRMLKEVYLKLGDWSSLTTLLPELRKHKVLEDDEMATLEQQCYANMLGNVLPALPVEADDSTRLQALNKEWKAIPSKLSSEEPLVRRYAELLIEAGSEDKAEAFLKDQLKKNWDENLVTLYGQVQGSDAHKQLETAKSWEAKHADSAALKLALARLSARNKQFGKAVEYAQASLAVEKSTDAYQELINQLLQAGESEQAKAVMEESRNFAMGNLSAEESAPEAEDKPAEEVTETKAVAP